MGRGRARTHVTDAQSSNSSSAGLQRAGASSAEFKNALVVNPVREALILERQSELDRVLDRHDDLVREAFHLDKYITMLRYDPVVAKTDQTAVFLEYKEKHDLVMNTPGAGPSRTTRRAQAERISALKGRPQRIASGPTPSQSISAPVLSGRLRDSTSATLKSRSQKKTNMPKPSVAAKGKQKESVSDEEQEVGSEAMTLNSEHSGILSSKARGKRKAIDQSPAPTSRVSRISRSQSSALTEYDSSTDAASLSTQQTKRNDDKFVPRASKRIRSKEEKLDPHLHITIPLLPSKSPASSAPARPIVAGKTVAGKSLPTSSPVVRPAIRRVRLIVREPPPTVSSPLQRPRLPRFNRSLPALLTSYSEIDGQEYSPGGLERKAVNDARVLHKAESLKKRGRLMTNVSRELDGGAPINRAHDVWAAVVSEAIAVRNTIPRHRFFRSGALASSVSSKLHAHWDTVKTREEREVVAEEKRLRTLARTILRLVLGEWKKVVFHVREEERRVLDAEEKRRGRQHLDAILDQSGQILNKQQMELVRADVARSRSGTVSVDDDDEATDEEDEDEGRSSNEEGSDIGGDEDASDAGSDIEDANNTGSFALVNEASPETPKSDNYIEFSVPLNDVDADMEESVNLPSENGTQDNQSLVDEDENEEDLVRSELQVDNDEDEETAREQVFVETESILVRDNHIQDEEVHDFGDMGSSKTSLESTPFFDDIHLHGGDELHLDLNMDPPLEDLHSPASDDAHDFGNDNVIMPSGPTLEGRSGLPHLPLISKSLPTIVSTIDSSEVSGVCKEPLTDDTDTATRSKFLVEGAINNGLTEIAENHSTEANESLKPLTLNGFSAETHPPSEVSIPQEQEGIVADNVILSNGLDGGEQSAESHAHKSEVITVQNKRALPKSSPTPEPEPEWEAPPELQPYAVARVNWSPEMKLAPPLLLRGTLRPYQQSGLEWLATLHNNQMNGILADEMGLGKTIQTISLLAHLACDRGIWGPHLIIVPTSVLLNWEMEFKKFLPGFKILSYHGTTKRRKELRQGWNTKHAFNVCVTSYTLASRDQHIFKRKAWYYMILDEAHMIKNFKSQRWNILLMFRSFRRLLLTGTPLQNNLTELWALLQFLMSGTTFANLKDFGEWFASPLEKAIEQGNVQDQEVQIQVTKLHTVLRPYLLRRLKRDVEKELPSKYDHLVLCRLSKRQRFLYDEFMSRNQTREDLKSGVYQKIANILMQLRKVCNHPDLFEVRPVVTSFAMDRSAIADFEIKELLVRRMLLQDDDRFSHVNLDVLGLQFTHLCNTSSVAARETRSLEEILAAEVIAAYPGEPPPRDTRTIEGYRKYRRYQLRAATYARFQQMVYLNRLRCDQIPIYGLETIEIARRLCNPLTSACEAELLSSDGQLSRTLVKSYSARAEDAANIIDKFAFATPAVVARDLPSIVLRGLPEDALQRCSPDFDSVLHRASVKLQIAFPDVSLLQYDCGKLQELARLLRERKSGGHRVLIFTQMTKILDILEMFLNFHGYLYLRLDGATKIEDRQYITERFNVDERIFAFIASSRSGGVGINLTGADTVVFYDSDFNPQMDRQCEDRAHRIGQIRDVHIYRFISQYTVEEAMLHKANQKRSLDDLVIQQGEFDWTNFFRPDEVGQPVSTSALQKALVEFEDFEDAHAAKVAANEEAVLEGEDRADFADADSVPESQSAPVPNGNEAMLTPVDDGVDPEPVEDDDGEGGTTIDYMLKFVRSDREFFREWKLT